MTPRLVTALAYGLIVSGFVLVLAAALLGSWPVAAVALVALVAGIWLQARAARKAGR